METNKQLPDHPEGSPPFRMIRVLLDLAEKIFSAISVGMLIILTLIIFYDGIARYFRFPTVWVFEYSVYLFMFIGFISNALAVKRFTHFRVTFMQGVFPRYKAVFDLIADLSVLVFGVILLISGVFFTNYLWKFDIKSTSLLDTPLWIPSISMGIGGATLVLQTINMLLAGGLHEGAKDVIRLSD